MVNEQQAILRRPLKGFYRKLFMKPQIGSSVIFISLGKKSTS